MGVIMSASQTHNQKRKLFVPHNTKVIHLCVMRMTVAVTDNGIGQCERFVFLSCKFDMATSTGRSPRHSLSALRLRPWRLRLRCSHQLAFLSLFDCSHHCRWRSC
jgi:hypothetical protein